MVQALLVVTWHCQSVCSPNQPSPVIVRNARIRTHFLFFNNTNYISPVKMQPPSPLKATRIAQAEDLSGHGRHLVTPTRTICPVLTHQSMLCPGPLACAQSRPTRLPFSRPLNTSSHLEQSLQYSPSGEREKSVLPGFSVHESRWEAQSPAARPPHQTLPSMVQALPAMPRLCQTKTSPPLFSICKRNEQQCELYQAYH